MWSFPNRSKTEVCGSRKLLVGFAADTLADRDSKFRSMEVNGKEDMRKVKSLSGKSVKI